MLLTMQLNNAIGYTSGSQIARRMTEAWVADNLFCVACESTRISSAPCNSKANDFNCPDCGARYELKAGKTWNEHKIPDAGYFAMIDAIRSDSVPNLLVMQYTFKTWNVKNLTIVPSFFFNESSVEKRKPLSPTARSAGWVGCNILLSAIAPEGKVKIIDSGVPRPLVDIRKDYCKYKSLENIGTKARGWTLDVLNFVQQLNKKTFSLDEVYYFESRFKQLYPNNLNIRPKIRQQLQVLRDLGFIQFIGNGEYNLIK